MFDQCKASTSDKQHGMAEEKIISANDFTYSRCAYANTKAIQIGESAFELLHSCTRLLLTSHYTYDHGQAATQAVAQCDTSYSSTILQPILSLPLTCVLVVVLVFTTALAPRQEQGDSSLQLQFGCW